MKKLIAVLLMLGILTGCGNTAAPADSSPDAATQGSTTDKKSSKLISEEELKTLLIGQQFPCSMRYVWNGEIKEKSNMQDSDLMYTIQEVMDITYTAEKIDRKETNEHFIEIKGTLNALGTMWEKSGEEDDLSKATAEPVNFKVTVNPEKTTVSYFDTEKIILVKPANPVDLENLPQYLDKDKLCRYLEPNPKFRADGKKNGFGEYIEQEYFVKKIDLNSTQLRIEVVSNLFDDPAIMNKDIEVDVFDGDKYLGSCTMNISQDFDTDVIFLGDIKPKK